MSLGRSGVDLAPDVRRPDARVERSPEGDVAGEALTRQVDVDIRRVDVGRHVSESNARDPILFDHCDRLEASRGCVDDDAVRSLAPRQAPRLGAQVTRAMVPCPQAVE